MGPLYKGHIGTLETVRGNSTHTSVTGLGPYPLVNSQGCLLVV